MIHCWIQLISLLVVNSFCTAKNLQQSLYICQEKNFTFAIKVEKILKGSLDSIPSPSVKIQFMGGKVCLRCKDKTYERFIPFSFFVNDEKRKNQLYWLCLKMTADFGNFVTKNDKKQKMK